ncbi:MAG: dihydroorotate dehydrogenase [Planctomycetes bacterium]|nr:dihydroorotate dehydrogenase [Planctomycetota bacterium]
MTPSSPTPAATPPAAAVDLSIDLAGLKLANPMMTASGTCGYGYEYADFTDLSRLGAFVTKSITAEARKGNEAYRIVETRGGMLNAIGLANVGLDAFLADKLPQLRKLRATGPRVIVNVAGHSTDDYVKTCARVAAEPDVDAIELNVSCPNVKDGLTFGTDPRLLRELCREVRTAMAKNVRLIVKLSPNVGDIVLTARAAVEGGADVLSMINTYTAMTIDIHKRRPRLANGTGGLSGPAIRPLAVYLLHRVYRHVAREAKVPIIGMGGIQYWQDAAEFLLAGASGLAVGTALFVDPATPVKITEGLAAYLQKQGCKSLREIVGTLALHGEPPVTPYP